MPDRILIVGAGVIGAAIAYRLAQGGARVTVIEAETPAAGASGRSFGWINASFSLDTDHFHLRVAAMTAHHALASDLGDSHAVWPGAISWEEEGAAQEETFVRLSEAGYPVRRLGGAEIAKLEPALGAPPSFALHFPSEGLTDLAALTRSLLAAAARHGAKLLQGLPATAVATRNGAVSGLVTAEGPIEAGRIVIAAGAGAPALIAPLGLSLPMLRRPALLLRTRPLPPVIRHILVSPALELRQEADGCILAPTSPNHQADESETLPAAPEALAEAAMAELRRMFPGLALDWQETMRAFRPVPGDGFPVIGPTAVPGLYLSVMHSGATLAALVGSLVARELLQGRDEPMLARYRPARFA